MPWHVPQQYDDPGHSRHKVAAGRRQPVRARRPAACRTAHL